MMCASIHLSSAIPTIAAGIEPTTISSHRRHVARFSAELFLNENGFRRLKNAAITAKIAPSCITTRNVS